MESKLLDCQILTSPAEIESLAPQWRELHERAGTSIFTDYDWFDIWWRNLGNNGGRTLHIVTGRMNGKLVALLPLAIVVRKGFRTLQATGAEAFYLSDMLCEDAAYADEIWRAARQSPHYDFAHIRDVCPGSANELALASFANLHDQDNNITLRLEWNTGEEWLKSLSAKLRRKIKRWQQLLEEQGPVRYHLCETLPLPEGIIEGLVVHKTAWCVKYGLEGMFDQPNILEFYRQMAQKAAQRGDLLLAWLTCGETIIAYHIMFKYKKTLYNYAMAVDPAWLKSAPGILAHVKAISWAIENGFELFDHMQGDFSYKYQFANRAVPCKEFTFSKSLRGWVGENLFIKRRAVKRWLSKKKEAA